MIILEVGETNLRINYPQGRKVIVSQNKYKTKEGKATVRKIHKDRNLNSKKMTKIMVRKQ